MYLEGISRNQLVRHRYIRVYVAGVSSWNDGIDSRRFDADVHH